MDPSSNQSIISSKISVATQPHQPAAKSITHMDVALYNAAARGKMEDFSNFQGSQLESLLTPNGNTVLHVHLATKDPFDVLGSEKQLHNNVILRYFLSIQDRFGRSSYGKMLRTVLLCRALGLGRLPVLNEKLKFKTSFIPGILNKSPSLLVQPNAKGQTPLHIAAKNGDSDAVKFLINYQAKALQQDLEKQGTESVKEMLRKTDLESNTALHVAAQNGDLQVVKELLEFEDPDFSYPVNRNQETPLYIAARRGYHSLLAIMLEKFKSPNLGGPHGRTVLHAAAMAGNAGTTRIILEKNRSLAKGTDENGQTPLHYAAHLGHYSVVKQLLKRDKSAAYIADKKWEMTPLLMAARQGHELTVREIISICPDCCELVDKRGWNLLHFAALRRGLSELRIFLKDGDGVKNFTTPYASIRELKDEKDALGITPAQVFDAYYVSGLRERLSGEKNQPTKQLERTVKLLEEIVKKKQVSEAPVRPIREEKDALPAEDKKEQIAKLLEDIVNDEVAEEPVLPIVDDAWFNSEMMKERKDAHLVVAALIATVTFASALAVPGGHNGDENSEQGTPFLIRDAAFKAFVISDAVAFLTSVSAIAIHFSHSFPFSKNQRLSLDCAAACITYAVIALMIAFGTGTYAILYPCPSLAISTLCIGLFFFFYVWGFRKIQVESSQNFGFY